MTGAAARRATAALTKKVAAAVAAQLEIDGARVAPASRLVDDLGMDSLAAAEIVARLEDDFDIEFEMSAVEALAQVQTVTDLADVVAASLPQGARRPKK